MGHRGMNRRHRRFVGCHVHDSAEDFQETGIPIFSNVMPRGESGIDESFKIAADCFANFQSANAEIADRILREAWGSQCGAPALYQLLLSAMPDRAKLCEVRQPLQRF
jgi:hypothetical protein